ncbi:hypothetical protein MCOR06_011122 [Pyricularia oryzae]|nr:hypothetical protein MCOR06_011122 [Pyricularia oryzae]
MSPAIAAKESNSGASRNSESVDNEDDAQTQFSQASSLWQHPDTEAYLSAFAKEMAAFFTPRSSAAGQNEAFKQFPHLLKAFAVRIGHERGDAKGRQVMATIYKFRNEIISELRKQLSQINQEELECLSGAASESEDEDIPTSKAPGMTLEEKMRLFDKNDTHNNGARDDWSSPEEAPLYQDILLNSEAYQWLRFNVQALQTLEIPGPATWESRISAQVLNALPRPAKLSRRRVQQVQLDLAIDWNPIQFWKQQAYREPIRTVVANAITLIGFGDFVQAMTAQEYLEQTWPRTGLEILAVLQNALPDLHTVNQPPSACLLDEGNSATATLSDGTSLTIRVSDLSTHACINGNAFAVAEVVEQLVWLGAALRPSPYPQLPTHSAARLVDFKVGEEKTGDSSDIRGSCDVSYDFVALEAPESETTLPHGGCWRGMFRNPVVATGFPIRSRNPSITENCGMEMSLGLVALLTNCRQVVPFAGTTFLKGFAAMLAAVKIVGDTVLWHLCYNPQGGYISYEDPRVDRSGVGVDAPQIPLQVIRHKRSPAANYEIEYTDLPPPSSSCVFEKVTIVGSGVPFITPEATVSVGVRDKPLHLAFGSGPNYMGLLSALEFYNFVLYDAQERRAWLVDGVSTVLHLLRAYLAFVPRYSRGACFFNQDIEGQIEEACDPAMTYTGAQAAWKVLANEDNQNIALYPKQAGRSKEKITTLNAESSDTVIEIKDTKKNFTLGERVVQLCETLLQIVAYHKEHHSQSGYQFRPRKGLRNQIEGFEFLDVAFKQDTINPKVATLKCMGWTDFANNIHAVPLFGVGFGELLRPKRSEGNTVCCISTASVPMGSDFLAAYGADLHLMLRLGGSKSRNPWRIATDLYWHAPDGEAFSSCLCDKGAPDADNDHASHKTRGRKGKDVIRGLIRREAYNPADRAQLGLKSPTHIVSTGAVIFGHSRKFPLRWDRKGDKPPETGEPDHHDEEDTVGIATQMGDSGIGTSVDSSSVGDKSSRSGSSLGGNASASSPSAAPNSMYALGCNPAVPVDEDSRLLSARSATVEGDGLITSQKRSLCESQTGDADDDDLGNSRKLRRVGRGLGRIDPEAPECP